MENKFKHTKEPWSNDRNHISIKEGQTHIGTCYGSGTSKLEDNANAARIVDCVNAMADIEQPEQFVKNSLQNALRMLELQAENEKLKEALAKIYTCDVSVCENQYEIIYKLREIADKALKQQS